MIIANKISDQHGFEYPLILVLLIGCTVMSFGLLFLLMDFASFYYYIIPFFLFLSIILLLFKHKKMFSLLEKTDLFACCLSFFAGLLTYTYHHVCLWGGYDDGVYSFFALHMSKTGSALLNLSGYPIYAGFNFTKNGVLTAQFPPGYSYFLSIFCKYMGINGIFIANATLLSSTMLLIYFLVKRVSSTKAALISITLYSLHYTTLWFSRRTLSENLLVPIVWLAFLLLIIGIDECNADYIVASFIPPTLGLLVRVEAFTQIVMMLFLSLVMFIINKLKWKRGIIYTKKYIILSLIIILLNLFNFFYYIARIQSEYFMMYINDMLNKLNIISTLGRLNPVAQLESHTWNNYVLRYVFDCFDAYLLIAVFVLAFFGIREKKYRYKFLILTILISPSFYLLRFPTISWTHPWFMRHYWVMIIPLMIIAGSVGITAIRSRKLRISVVALILITFTAMWGAMVTFSEENKMPETLGSLHSLLGDTDSPIIVSLEVHYISEPLHFLYGYWTISSNYDNLDKTKVLEQIANEKEIFVISSKTDTNPDEEYEILPNFKIFPDEDLESVGAVNWPRNILVRDNAADKYVIPENIPAKKINRGYQPLRLSVENLPPTRIRNTEIPLYVYKVKESEI